MAKQSEQAFKLAQAHDQVEHFASMLGDNGSTDEYLAIGIYFEGKKDYASAGQYFVICGDYVKALRLYLQCGEQQLDAAIDVIKRSLGRPEQDLLVRQLTEFLAGDIDGRVKDPIYMYRLYMAVGDYPQAASTALLIANQEQRIGNYKVAHGILLETYRELEQQQLPISEELKRSLILLHSYILVKRLVGNGDHSGAARMLLRVAKNISRFPAHVVQILTSVVIECHRANLKKSAFEYARTLLQPDYRKDIMEKYKPKIEAIVRRPSDEEEEEKMSPCPYCNFELFDTVLDCPQCHNSLPFCIASGRHMVASDWTVCPSCRFPALYTQLKDMLDKGPPMCPMCDQNITSNQLTKITIQLGAPTSATPSRPGPDNDVPDVSAARLGGAPASMANPSAGSDLYA
eukprot:TRINITY_DN9540_c0_g1_i8.p1 TRINITY_DN9540_c0_g1~~TRINITY_DN9540_c0_g1_i8.p1  ORF type:complete len:402 (+),score=109.73 TRINITY_DN9540_c0_g1_i8:43-1248(+)